MYSRFLACGLFAALAVGTGNAPAGETLNWLRGGPPSRQPVSDPFLASQASYPSSGGTALAWRGATASDTWPAPPAEYNSYPSAAYPYQPDRRRLLARRPPESAEPLYDGAQDGIYRPHAAFETAHALPPPQFELEEPPRRPGGQRDGLFQRFDFVGTALAGASTSEFGVSEVELSATFGFPFPSKDSPLVVTPGFAVHFLEGPASPDMPARLYDSYVQFRLPRKINDDWAIDVAVTPGWYSDHESSNDEALRITGHAFGIWTCTERLSIMLGVVYLDRSDVSLLPAAGLIWAASEDRRLELIVPRPRYAVRYYCSETEERWWYIAGEFGGGTWAIVRAGGSEDLVDYSDFRVMLGCERKVSCGLGGRIELGYVFNRAIEYDSGTPDFEPEDTILIRAGVTY